MTVEADAVTDTDEVDPPDNMAGDHTFSFSTTGLTLRIHDIQDQAHLSPYDGSLVSQVPGVVTAVSPSGFYMQDPEPDADLRTSEGIFVFGTTTVVPGTAVRVSGRVQEFRAGCFPSCPPTASGFDNLTITEIVTPTVVSAGAVPAIPATVVGLGGRVPPTLVIEDDSAGNVETSNTFDPDQDGIDFYESLEGMLVQVNNAVAVGPRNDFGEISVLSDDGSNASVRTGRGGIVIRANDFNPERMILDDVIRPTPPVDVRDGFTTPVSAVVDYGFGNFKFLVLNELTPVDGGLTREVTEAQRKNELAVATFNVENLDPTDSPAKFAALARLMVHNLRSPDLFAIEEVQDNTGPATGPVDRCQPDLADADRGHRGPGRPDLRLSPDQPALQPGRRRAGRQHPAGLPLPDRPRAVVRRPAGRHGCDAERRSWTRTTARSCSTAPGGSIRRIRRSRTAGSHSRASSAGAGGRSSRSPTTSTPRAETTRSSGVFSRRSGPARCSGTSRPRS